MTADRALERRLMRGIGCLVIAMAAACAPDSDAVSETGVDSTPVSATVFPDSPADGPMPEIGPAPEGYQPTAAGSPSTDIWLGSLVRVEAGVSVENLINATDRDGYDNQPSFGPDGALYFVSAIDRVQTEVMRHASGDPRQTVTRTPRASEFSPTPIPGQDAFSAIHEERGKQYLWRYGFDGNEIGPIFATAEPVGYHAWANETVVAMFILGDPPTLQVGDAATGQIRVMAVADDEWWIERLDASTGESERIVQTLPGREDYAWTASGGDPDGRRLRAPRVDADTGWSQLQDLGSSGVQEISRIAVSPDGGRIAVVSGRE